MATTNLAIKKENEDDEFPEIVIRQEMKIDKSIFIPVVNFKKLNSMKIADLKEGKNIPALKKKLQTKLSDSEDDLPISRLNALPLTQAGLSNADDDSDVPLNSLYGSKPVDQKYMDSQSPIHTYTITSTIRKMKKKLKRKKKSRAKRRTYTKLSQDDFVCPICGLDKVTKKKYDQHMKGQHGRKYTCEYCGLKFSDWGFYKDHENTHTGDTPYQCEACPAEYPSLFTTKTKLNRHCVLIHGFGQPLREKKKNQYRCHICEKELSSQGTLAEHIRLHTGDRPVTCDICHKNFIRDRDLKQHMNLHEESWKCRICTRCFVTPFKLKEHYRTHSGERPYECTKCDRKFARAADFRYHAGTHLGLKPYACDICDLRFTTSSSVTRHKLNMHATTPRDFLCPICKKTFFTEARLRTHIKNHDRAKRVPCNLCPFKFVSQTELRRHIKRKHSGDYPCTVCSIVCTTKQQFDLHMDKHDFTGKPYSCNVCKYAYKTSQSLTRHLASTHKNEDIPKAAPQHVCVLCGQIFHIKDKLNRHLKDDHVVLVTGEVEILDETDPEEQEEETEEHEQAEDEKADPLEPKLVSIKTEVINIKTEPPDGSTSPQTEEDGRSSSDDDDERSPPYLEVNFAPVCDEPTDLSIKPSRLNGIS